MKTIHCAQSKVPCRYWRTWIEALVESGFKVNRIEPDVLETATFRVGGGEAILLDGMTPRLNEILHGSVMRFPDACIVVATVVGPNTSRYDAIRCCGQMYSSKTLPTDQFAESLRGIFAALLSNSNNKGNRNAAIRT